MDADLRAFLTEKFDAIDQRFETIDQRLEASDRRFDAIDRRFDASDQRFEASDRRSAALEQKNDETRRELRLHFDVTAESLLGTIQLIAEQHSGLGRRIDDLIVENRREHQETRALLRLSYTDLDRRVIRLEQRVDRLEQQGS